MRPRDSIVCIGVTPPRGLGLHRTGGSEREAAGRTVNDLHLPFPRQTIAAGDHVLHVGVRTVLCATGDSDEAAMAELIDVVLDAPSGTRLADEIGPHFGGDDLVDAAARPMREDGAVEIDDHAFAHGIERAVAAAHANVHGDHQITERVRLIGEAPRLPDRCGVTRGAKHDLRALVGAFARHLREHAVVTDDEG